MTDHRVVHDWSAWRALPAGPLERRCACGAVERTTVDVLVGEALAAPLAAYAAFRRAFFGVKSSED